MSQELEIRNELLETDKCSFLSQKEKKCHVVLYLLKFEIIYGAKKELVSSAQPEKGLGLFLSPWITLSPSDLVGLFQSWRLPRFQALLSHLPPLALLLQLCRER
jgi:hypothetical protein